MPPADVVRTNAARRRGTPGPARIHDTEASGDMLPEWDMPPEWPDVPWVTFADAVTNVRNALGNLSAGLQEALQQVGLVAPVPEPPRRMPSEPVPNSPFMAERLGQRVTRNPRVERERGGRYRVTYRDQDHMLSGLPGEAVWIVGNDDAADAEPVSPVRSYGEQLEDLERERGRLLARMLGGGPDTPNPSPRVASGRMAGIIVNGIAAGLTERERFGKLVPLDAANAAYAQRDANMPRRRNRQLCECGCGNMTETGRFLRGHATRRRWQLIKAAELGTDDRTVWVDPANGRRTLAAVRYELGQRGWRMPVSRRSFGIEFELLSPVDFYAMETALSAAGIKVYNHGSYTTRNAADAWTLKTDSSIHTTEATRGYRGIEVVSPILRGKRGEAQVRKVVKVLNDLGCKVNKTCGTHVHVGATDLSVDGIRNVVLGYAEHQNAIHRLHAPSRRGESSYCLPHSGFALGEVRGASNVSEMAGYTRYLNVNLGSYPRIGTIEFRQHGGTLNATKILAWMNLVRGMVQEAPKTDLSAGSEFVTRNGTRCQTIVPLLRAAKVNNDTFDYLYARWADAA